MAEDPTAWAAALVGCPQAYFHCTLNGWQGKVPQTVERWAKGDGDRWALTLIGRPGSGKTHLATAVLNSLAGERLIDTQPKDDRGSLWLAARHIPDLVLAGLENVGSLARYGVMLIDDVGRGESSLGRELAVRLLMDRYDRRAPTIVTANAEQIQDVDVLDPAVTSRLCEGDVVRLRGRDYRMRRR